MTQADFDEFTVSGYRELLQLAKAHYRFLSFPEALAASGAPAANPQALWRHDVDFSVHRAARLAGIEAELGLRTTYFFMLRSSFYNLLEKAVLEKARQIVAAGHFVGLHFDFDCSKPVADAEQLAERISFECRIVEDTLETGLTALSFHNPDIGNASRFDQDRVAGLVNAYGAWAKPWHYVSDSNGYWRFTPLRQVLEAHPQRLHVLTHPAWWVDHPASPRDRIKRAIDGRAQSTAADYDRLLADNGRLNLR